MKLKITSLLLLTIMALFTTPLIFSQESLQLNFQGILRDIEENIIQEDEFLLIVNVLSDPAGKTIWEKPFSITTDNDGWFGFEIENFNQVFGEESAETSVVSLHLGLFSTENSKWIEQGNDFLVSYTIKRSVKHDSIIFEIKRMEGSVLLFSQIDNTLFFQDTYPFAYLQGGFMLCVDKTAESLVSLRHIIEGNPDAPEEATKSRGMKGGFAVGGYRKNR